MTDPACWLILASALFDWLDGWTARRLNRTSRFGAAFDSAADFISFGCAPAFIFCGIGGTKAVIAVYFMSIYILASAIRLVRFNAVCAGLPHGQNRNFEGLPTTASAVFLAILMLFFPEYFKEPALSVPAFGLLSLLMLSRITFWKLVR